MRVQPVVLLTLLTATSVASAQPSDSKAVADQLFTEGKDLSKQGKWAEACPKFEASLRYDPALGTRLNLATCYDKVGKVASAWALFKEAADLARKAGDDKRRDFAAKQVTALEPRLPHLKIIAPTPAPPALIVTRGGVTVDAALYGVATVVDPGEVEIVASAPDHEPFATKLVVVEGKTSTIEVPALTPRLPTPDEPPPPDGPALPPPDVEERPVPAPPAAPSGTRKVVGLATIGVGAVAVGVGAYFGVAARGNFADAKSICGGDLSCDSPADLARSQAEVDDARSQALLSTVLVGVGAAAVVGGAVVWLTAPSRSEHRDRTAVRITPVVSRDRAALVVGGSF
jgi:hypothetical protein